MRTEHRTTTAVRFRRGKQISILLAGLALLLAAGGISAAEEPQAPTMVPPAENQARLADLREEFAQNTRNLRLLEEQLSQTAPVKDLSEEVKRLRAEIGALVAQLEADPAAADAIGLKLQELRVQREEKDAARLAALNETADYRALNERRAQLMDEIRGLLTAGPRGAPPAAAPEM
ncbi:MAG: hypothetical protein EOL90_02910 [Spartobacteria bacterium]|nr:hypothetical protein [Spartobacteria bacterium]